MAWLQAGPKVSSGQGLRLQKGTTTETVATLEAGQHLSQSASPLGPPG